MSNPNRGVYEYSQAYTRHLRGNGPLPNFRHYGLRGAEARDARRDVRRALGLKETGQSTGSNGRRDAQLRNYRG